MRVVLSSLVKLLTRGTANSLSGEVCMRETGVGTRSPGCPGNNCLPRCPSTPEDGVRGIPPLGRQVDGP